MKPAPHDAEVFRSDSQLIIELLDIALSHAGKGNWATVKAYLNAIVETAQSMSDLAYDNVAGYDGAWADRDESRTNANA